MLTIPGAVATRLLFGLALATAIACGDDDVGTTATAGALSAGTTEGATTDGTTTEGGATDGTTAGGESESAGMTTTAGTTTTATSGMTETTGTTTADTADTEDTADTSSTHRGFVVGFDVTDISPDEEQLAGNNIYMGAYGAPFSRGPAMGVHDRIYARSMAIEAGGVGLVMAVVDLPGMGNQNTRAIREMVAGMTGLAVTTILVGTTHSHSAPDLMGLWGGTPDEYRDQVNALTAASMAAAWESREPAELFVATGEAPNRNRRGWDFTDDSMVVLDARDLEGQRLGTLVNFAAHPVILGEDNKEISCDYPGFMVQALEAELGVPVALFNGILGDVSPKVPEGDYVDGFHRAEVYGEALAAIASGLVATAEPITPVVVTGFAQWIEEVDNTLFKLAVQLGILQYDFDMKGLFGLEVKTQINYFRLGAEVQGVAFPGESLTRNGLAIKEAMKAPHRLFLGNTGDALGYFIPSDEWNSDNYEEGVSLGESAGDNARDAALGVITADNENF